MINQFLKAKHWQLFALTFGIPFFLYIILIASLVSKIATQGTPDFSEIFDYMKTYGLVIFLVATIIFGWLWSVVIGLQNKIPEHIKMKTTRFKVFILIPTIYFIGYSIFMVFFFIDNINIAIGPNFVLIGQFVAIILPLHLFSIFCMFHTFYFVAKTIRTVEFQQPVKFGDFAGELFLIWFFPIGIWILQPRINKILESSNIE